MRVALALALLWAAPAMAQELDCSAPVTQNDINQCAEMDWRRADVALNDSYAMAVAAARDMGKYSDTDIEEALRAAQRAWVTFRDLACAVESLQAEGGSMQPMLFSGCMTRLTLARIDDLHYFSGTDR